MERILVTGGLGFIGSNLIHELLNRGYMILNIDKNTYASNDEDKLPFSGHKNYSSLCLELANYNETRRIIAEFKPHYVFHCAAESHVDNSIYDPEPFISSNIIATYNLIEALRRSHYKNFKKFIHVSTDEVFGHLGEFGSFNEGSPYRPNSPYSASKAASDLLVRAWRKTFDIPMIITNCSNNYGPYQHPEKMIPKSIKSILNGEGVSIYGDGTNVRNWLFVVDHVKCLCSLIDYHGSKRQFLIGSDIEISNEHLVELLHKVLSNITDVEPLTKIFVNDRPAHDFRYSVDYTKTTTEIGWTPEADFIRSLETTAKYYIDLHDI